MKFLPRYLVTLLAVGFMGLGVKTLAQSIPAPQGFLHGHGLFLDRTEPNPPCPTTKGGLTIQVNADGGLSGFNSATCSAFDIPLEVVITGTLADAGGSGKSCAATAGVCGIALPFGTAADCNCTETSVASNGVACGLAAWTDGGTQLNVIGCDITALEAFKCRCRGL